MVHVVTRRGRGDDPAHQIDSGFRPHAAEYADDPVPVDAHDVTPDRKDRTHSRTIVPIELQYSSEKVSGRRMSQSVAGT